MSIRESRVWPATREIGVAIHSEMKGTGNTQMSCMLYAGILPGAVGCTLQMVGQRAVNPTLASMMLKLIHKIDSSQVVDQYPSMV